MTTFSEAQMSEWSEDTQNRFIAGWEGAGGYMDDLDSPRPWCCPWLYTDITVDGDTPEQWGASYWAQSQEEVERLLAEEDEYTENE